MLTVVSLFWIGSIRSFGLMIPFFWLDDSVLLAWQPIGMFRSFGLTQKNQKVKAAPSGLLRFAAVGKWMKLASLKQHPFLFRPPRRSA